MEFTLASNLLDKKDKLVGAFHSGCFLGFLLPCATMMSHQSSVNLFSISINTMPRLRDHHDPLNEVDVFNRLLASLLDRQPPETIQELVQQYPLVLMRVDPSNGYSLLHHACSIAACPDVVRLLLLLNVAVLPSSQ
jgi:hypothetical protein